MALKSFVQTVEVAMPNSTNKFLTMKMAPPRVKFQSDEMCTKMQYDAESASVIYWEPDGLIRIKYANGLLEVYHPKPTFAGVVKDRQSNRGEYYRIHADGSVEHGFDSQYYFWGPEEEVDWDMSNIYWAPPAECSCIDCIDDAEDSEDEVYIDEFNQLCVIPNYKY